MIMVGKVVKVKVGEFEEEDKEGDDWCGAGDG